MERCLPADAPDEELSDEEVTRRAAPRAIKALGAARVPHIRAHFTRDRYPQLPRGARGLREPGRVERIEVEGLGDDWWIHAEDLETLDADFRPRTALLSPVRQPAVRPRAHRAAVRLRAPARDLHAQAEAPLGLLRAAGAATATGSSPAPTWRWTASATHWSRSRSTRSRTRPRGKRLPQAIRRELERLAAWRGATAHRDARGAHPPGGQSGRLAPCILILAS